MENPASRGDETAFQNPANHHDLSVTTEDENTFLKGTMASSIKENL